MYPNPLVINNGTEAISYDSRGGGENNSRYVHPATSGAVSDESVVAIKHTNTNVNTINERRRSVMRVDIPVSDAQGNRDVIVAYVVSQIPTRIADVNMCDMALNSVKNFLATSGYIAKFINGEI